MSYWLDKNRMTFFLVLDLMEENSTAHFFVCDDLQLSSKYFSGQSTAFLDWSQRLYTQFLIPTFPPILCPVSPSLFSPARFLCSSLSNLSCLLFLRPLKAEILVQPHFSYVLFFPLSLSHSLFILDDISPKESRRPFDLTWTLNTIRDAVHVPLFLKCVTLLAIEGAAVVRQCWKFISKDTPTLY